MTTFNLVIDVESGAMTLVDRAGRRRPYGEAYQLSVRAHDGDELAARALLAFDHVLVDEAQPIPAVVARSAGREQSFLFRCANLAATEPSEQTWWQVKAEPLGHDANRNAECDRSLRSRSRVSDPSTTRRALRTTS